MKETYIYFNERTKHIKETSNVRIPERLENLVNVPDYRDRRKESDNGMVLGFAFATYKEK